jgi:hypothetical protein
MKINFKKITSISLQTLGVIFLLLIITRLCFYFYYRIDGKLQGFSWQLLNISDKSGNNYDIKEGNNLKLKFKGIADFRILFNECGEYKFGYERGYLNSIYVSSYSIEKACFNSKQQTDYYNDLFSVLMDWKKYEIRNDSLWVITREHKYAIFKKQGKK